MHNEILVSVVHCSANYLKQLQTRGDIQPVQESQKASMAIPSTYSMTM